MDNRDKYITMRNANQLEIGILYLLATDMGFELDISSFRVGISVPEILTDTIKAMDRHLGLTILEDSQGRFIKVVE